MKHYIILFTILLFTIIFNAQTSPHDMVEKMGRGINLGNVLSAPAEGNWSPAATEQYFIDVAAAGFTNVRIPIDFFGTRTGGNTAGYSSDAGTAADYTGTSNDYVVLNTYLDRIEQVIDWSLNQGLVTILDFHGSNLKSEFIYTFDVGESEYTEPNSAKRAADNDKYRAIWSQVADRFKDHSEDLLFEVINEPYFHMSKADMDALNAAILPIIRGSGGSNGTRNVIITGGTGTSHEAPLQIDPNIISGDSYLIATFHYYQPFDFTSSSADSRDEESWGTAAEKETLTTRFDEVLTFSNLHNIPVFLGEFGADNTGGYKYSTGDLNTISNNVTGFSDGGPDNASRVEYHRYVAEQAINRGFSFAAWDSGPKSNKTIHMREDGPSTVNYNINNFSVNSYSPKDTNISTIVDTSVWVDDIKNALFASGTWPLCYGSTDYIILNTGFEGGVDCNWSFNIYGNTAAASISDATTDAKNGSVGAKINVTTAGDYSHVILSNVPYTQGLTGKKITIKTFAKSFAAIGQSFKIRIKAIVNGISQINASSAFPLTNTYPEDAFEFEYIVPNNTTSIQVQIMLGKFTGIYFLDDFETTIEDDNTTWSGATNTDWATSANWNNGVPTNSLNASIPSGLSNYPVISGATAAAVKNLDVDASAALTIASGGSLIVSGTSAGNVTYNTTLGTENWYLVSSPVSGETYDNDFVAANSLAINGTNNAIGFYATADNTWSYMQNDASAAFTPGTGYSVRRVTSAGSGDISFTGTINTSDVAASIVTGGADSFNLIGNPFTAYLNSASFLLDNTGSLDTQTIWVWNQASGIYETKVTADAFVLAPTQGFFVNASSATNLNIAESYQANTGSAFQKTTNTEVKLIMNDGTNDRFAKLYYLDNATTGFDNGYDGKLFSGVAQPFAIYTHLVADSEGKKYQVQSLPNSDYENMVIAVGISADARKEIIFSAEALNLPTGLKVFLEDRNNNVFTCLDEVNATYKVTVDAANTDGRFYLHTKTSSLLSLDTDLLNSVNIYNTSTSNLKITGLQKGETTVSLFNLLGKQVMMTSFDGASVNNISLPRLAAGIYVVKLQTKTGELNKKIILE
jgi:endoglucanase